jgi:hypothetical protein
VTNRPSTEELTIMVNRLYDHPNAACAQLRFLSSWRNSNVSTMSLSDQLNRALFPYGPTTLSIQVAHALAR